MTEAAETKLQRRMMAQMDEIAALKKQLSHWQGKAGVQKNEIGRLTRDVEQLRADKRNLTFDINKQRARAEQLAEMVRSANVLAAEVPLMGAICGDMVKTASPTSGAKKGVA